MRWRIYYADGSTFDDEDGEPWQSPYRPRVVAIAQPCAGTRWEQLLINGTWYLWRSDLGCWTHHESEGDALDEHQEHSPHILATRKGKYIRRDQFTEIRKRIRQEVPGV